MWDKSSEKIAFFKCKMANLKVIYMYGFPVKENKLVYLINIQRGFLCLFDGVVFFFFFFFFCSVPLLLLLFICLFVLIFVVVVLVFSWGGGGGGGV